MQAVCRNPLAEPGLLGITGGAGLRREGGLGSERLVAVGIATAVVTLIVVVTDPLSTTLVLTWLSGFTYGRSLAQSLPVAITLLVLTPVVMVARRRLDLIALDDDSPRVLGVPLTRTRLAMLTATALLTAAAVSAAVVVGFVGLVAPHDRAPRTLHAGADLLTDRQRARVAALFAIEDHVQVEVTWGSTRP